MSSSHKSSATAAGAAGAPVTSPMLQQQESTTSAIAGAGGGVDGKRSLPKGAHVRFSHVEVDGAAQDTGKKIRKMFSTKVRLQIPSCNVFTKNLKWEEVVSPNGHVVRTLEPTC